MWNPLLREEVTGYVLHDVRVTPGEKTVFCLLSPDRLVIGDRGYEFAQQGALETYNALQRARDPPLPVALQEELWLDYDRRRDTGVQAGGRDASDLDAHGAVTALLAQRHKPEIFRLEKDLDRGEMDNLRKRFARFRDEALPFLREVIRVYEELAARLCSSGLVRTRAIPHEADNPSQEARLEELINAARAHQVPIPPEVRLIFRLRQLQPRLDEGRILWEEAKLVRELRVHSSLATLPRKAALEILLHEALHRGAANQTNQTRIAAYEAMLARYTPSLVHDDMVSQASQQLAEYVSFRGLSLLGSEIQRPHKGWGGYISQLLELAHILGIDTAKYTALRTYAHFTHVFFELNVLSNFAVSKWPSVIDGLEERLLQVMALTEQERTLVALSPAIQVLRSLTEGKIIYNTGAQAIMRRLRLEELWNAMAKLDAGLPASRHAEARRLDDSFEIVVESNDEGLRRGKLLGRKLVATMTEHSSATAILLCQSYLAQPMLSVLPPDFSYAVMMPTS